MPRQKGQRPILYSWSTLPPRFREVVKWAATEAGETASSEKFVEQIIASASDQLHASDAINYCILVGALVKSSTEELVTYVDQEQCRKIVAALAKKSKRPPRKPKDSAQRAQELSDAQKGVLKAAAPPAVPPSPPTTAEKLEMELRRLLGELGDYDKRVAERERLKTEVASYERRAQDGRNRLAAVQQELDRMQPLKDRTDTLERFLKDEEFVKIVN